MFRGASLRVKCCGLPSMTSFVVPPALAQIVPTGKVATFDGQGANAWSGDIPASDDELIGLLEEGIKRSPTSRL